MRAAVTFLGVALCVVMLVAAPVSAEVLHTTFPVAGTFYSPCTGELIAFAGDMHVLVGQLVDAAGAFELTLRSNFQGVTGAGLLSGTQYQIPADMGQTMSVGLPPVTVTAPNSFRVVGGTDNFAGQLPLTVSISTTGGVSANVGSLQFVCE